MAIKYITAKSILSSIKNDTYFGTGYSVNLYRGCSHGCIYCDSRSDCYQIENFDDILVKKNAIELLEDALPRKREVRTIGFGSMNDCYMPVEKHLKMTRRALEVLRDAKTKSGAPRPFPVHIITKSTLVTRDIDLLLELSKTYAAVSITITAAEDQLSKMVEPAAPPSSARFEALKKLSDSGIYCGITLMPVLPFIEDSEENISGILLRAKEAGVKYILFTPGMTIREGQREYFYAALDRKFPGLRRRYEQSFGLKYGVGSPNASRLWGLFSKMTQEFGISSRMDFFKPPKENFLF